MPKSLLWILAAVLSLAAFVGVLVVSPVGEPDDLPPGAVGHPDPYPAPDFSLVDHRGEERTLEDFRGRWLALFFGFTHCPDICPVTLGNVTRALEGLGEDAEHLAAALVSVDPERDTPERLAEYLEHFHPSITGLTGEQQEIEEVVGDYGIYAERFEEGEDAGGGPSGHASGGGGGAGASAPHETHGPDPEEVPGSGEGYMVDHSSLLLILDPQGRIVTSFAPFTPAEELEEGFRFLIENRGGANR